MFDPVQSHIVKEHKHDSPLISCRFDRAGQHVYFGAQDFKVWRWNWESDEKVELNHGAWVRGIALSPDGSAVLTGGYDGRLLWWPAAGVRPEPSRAIDAHQGWVRAVAVNPAGELVATAGNDQRVRLWNAADGAPRGELAGHQSHVYNVAFHPRENRLVSGDLKGMVRDWNAATGELVREFRAEALSKYDGGFLADIGGCRGLAFNAEGSRLAASGITNVTNAFAGVGNPAVLVYDWAKDQPIIQHESKAKLTGVAWGVAFHPTGAVVAAVGGNSGGFLLFWQPDGKEEFHAFTLPNTARDLDLSPDGMLAVTAHYDQRIRITRLAAKTG